MSLEVINKLLGLAAVDRQFEQELLQRPVTATQKRGFQLTKQEKELLQSSNAKNLQELSIYLLKHLQ